MPLGAGEGALKQLSVLFKRTWHGPLPAASHMQCCFASTPQLAPPLATTAAARSAARRCWAVLAALLAAAVANQRFQLPWVPEAMYLGTTALAATVTSHRLAAQWRAGRRPGQLPLLLLAAAALSLIGLCLPLDPLLCPLGGPWLGTVPLLFLGSDLGFVAVAALEAAGTADEATAAARRKSE